MMEDLENIILEGNLVSYALGEGDYLTSRPEIDYKRWSKLRDFYQNLDTSSALRRIIENEINALFSSDNERAKYASIAIGRILKLPNTIRQIKKIINSLEIDKYGNNLRNEIYFSAIILQIPETANLILKAFVKENRLGEFLLCSSIPPHARMVGDDDLWRLEMLNSFFDNNPDLRNSIVMQVNDTARNSYNFGLMIRKYLQLNPRVGEFQNMLENSPIFLDNSS